MIIIAENPDVGTSSEELWSSGGNKTYPTVNTLLEVVSSSTSDDVGGTGAIIVKIEGVDSDYVEVEEQLTMDGTTPVPSTKLFFRVNRFTVISAGTAGAAVGTLTCRIVSVGATQATVTVGSTRDKGSHFSVPAKKSLTVKPIALNTNANIVEFSIRCKARNGFVKELLRVSVTASSGSMISLPSVVCPEKNDFWIQCVSSAVTTKVSASLGIMLSDASNAQGAGIN